ncbi:hypothetical protein Trydic_g19595 [Trypoxylus dichotomus]
MSSSYLWEYQHGFVKNQSTFTNLSMLSQYLSECLDTNEQVDVIYMDFSKAFDRMACCWINLRPLGLLHLQTLRLVFDRLYSAGLVLNLDKCQFCRFQLKYLGFIVELGLYPDPDKVETILCIPCLSTVKVSWYRKSLARPLSSYWLKHWGLDQNYYHLHFFGAAPRQSYAPEALRLQPEYPPYATVRMPNVIYGRCKLPRKAKDHDHHRRKPKKKLKARIGERGEKTHASGRCSSSFPADLQLVPTTVKSKDTRVLDRIKTSVISTNKSSTPNCDPCGTPDEGNKFGGCATTVKHMMNSFS